MCLAGHATGYAHTQRHSQVKLALSLTCAASSKGESPPRTAQGTAKAGCDPRKPLKYINSCWATAAYNMAREKRQDESTFPEFKHSVSQCFPC
jgi:hypothetical protein